MKVFRSKNPTKRKSVTKSINFGLMMSALVLDDAMKIGFGLKLYATVLD